MEFYLYFRICAAFFVVFSKIFVKCKTSKYSKTLEQSSAKAAKIEGDFILGGLFPVHKKGLKSCGEVQPDRGMQRVEAMLFTVDHINNNPNVLPHTTLGAKILDTCSRETYALDQSLEYIRASLNVLDPTLFKCPSGTQPILTVSPEKVFAVVGGSYSSVSIQVANLLRLFKIPQVSYASTSAALSDKSRFEYFARTVPPDNLQAKAMADIIQYFNWSYVNTVASEGEYGEMGIDSFRQEARLRNVCIAVSEKVSQSATPERFDEIIKRLLTKPSARVVVLFLRVEDAKEILSAAKRQNQTNHFVWVASDGWGKEEMPVKGNDDAGEGAVTIELRSSKVEEFDVYFQELKPDTNLRNPWFIEYWEHVHECVYRDKEQIVMKQERKSNHVRSRYNHSERGNHHKPIMKFCTGDEALSSKLYVQESKMQFVFDAVYALAHALHNLLEDSCRHIQPLDSRLNCYKNTSVDGDVLYKRYLLNLSFQDLCGSTVRFDKNGDGIGQYNIMNYRRNLSAGKYEYITIGKWNFSGLYMVGNEYNASFDAKNDSSEQERPGTVYWTGNTTEVPESQCSRPCEPGQIKHVQQGESCCWVCVNCEASEIVKDEFSCEACPTGTWPSSPDKKQCIELEIQHMQWYSVFAIIPIILSMLGIFCTLLVAATFIKNFDTPVVKASGRELSFMLFGGFFLCYLQTFILLIKPSPIVCGVQRFSVGFGFSVIYSSLFTKTNRISRIFRAASKSAKPPMFISPKSQVILTLLLIAIQIVGSVVWLIMDPPHIRLAHPFGRLNEIVLMCGLRSEWFVVSLSYNMILIIVCTIYAVKTRKIPENFNESKHIGFTMYTTCIIWLAFIPIYFGTFNSFQIQITTLCISISLSAFVALACLFAPKLYVIWFHKNKQVRKLTMKTSSAGRILKTESAIGRVSQTTCNLAKVGLSINTLTTITPQPNSAQAEKRKISNGVEKNVAATEEDTTTSRRTSVKNIVIDSVYIL